MKMTYQFNRRDKFNKSVIHFQIFFVGSYLEICTKTSSLINPNRNADHFIAFTVMRYAKMCAHNNLLNTITHLML